MAEQASKAEESTSSTTACGEKDGPGEVIPARPAYRKPKPRIPRLDVVGDLTQARTRSDVPTAEAVIRDALEQGEAHTLTPEDLIWVVSKVGAWKSSWRAGQAIAAWLRHHGPIHKRLIDVAEEIAACDNAEPLDDVLLWIEPTPNRWYQHACWSVMLVHLYMSHEVKKSGREMPDDICAPDDVALYKRCAVESTGGHAKWVIAERGESARRSLRAAARAAEAGSEARLVLEAWAEVL